MSGLDEDRLYEVGEVGLIPVTQALYETDNEVTLLLFGEQQTKSIIPIKEACAKCSFWVGKFPDTIGCQNAQKKDAEVRGLTELICLEQFIA